MSKINTILYVKSDSDTKQLNESTNILFCSEYNVSNIHYTECNTVCRQKTVIDFVPKANVLTAQHTQTQLRPNLYTTVFVVWMENVEIDATNVQHVEVICALNMMSGTSSSLHQIQIQSSLPTHNETV